ncbi:hypothetical protein SmJEL517_g01658 [Synchytrium microbalum]|uniref:aspartate--tRNA ligase n=1 Tax=Synchytrium microbalum TaxID=1806994 RepID=A0A507CDP5_9FUNG|nr:uncharacterized protein SmJEL517_g01658 [Synchytrium microbalum]TPX36166.1 hypothetical protein SmJEL517_g01658 [Synchytrium microbalum]
MEADGPSKDVVLGEDGKPLSKAAIKKLEKEKEKAEKAREREAKLAAEKAAKEAAEVDVSPDKYGKLPLNQSQERTKQPRKRIEELSAANANEEILMRAKLGFFVLRQRAGTVQAVLNADGVSVSKAMLRFALSIPSESLVLIRAKVTVPPDPIKSCTVRDVELKLVSIHTISESVPRLPFTLESASMKGNDEDENDKENPLPRLSVRLDNRVIDLRTITNQAIFRLQGAISKLFREFLDSRDFVEIHTPKMMGAASEGGANVFKINYFKTSAYLAQSPQLHKQMSVVAGFERVYEIAPVFRAENSFTHRHMTEFIGLDLEMAFEEHYHEVLELLGDLFVYIFDGLKKRYGDHLDTVGRQYPFEEFQYLRKTLILQFKDGVAMLKAAGIEMGEFEDLTTANERTLGKLVKEKYETDFYILDKFPLAVRPFYTMPDPKNAGYSNSYDFFIRGEEIMSGAQRVHDAAFLEQRAREHGVEISTIQPYIDAFKYGAPPHAGGGIGLERVVMLYLNLGNIRKTSLFPRDPVRLAP